MQRETAAAGEMQFEVQVVNGTRVRARQHSAGARREAGQALGRFRGGFGTKLQLQAEGRGKTVAFVLTHGQRHEGAALEGFMSQEAVKRLGARRACIKPAKACGDRDYNSGNILSWLSRKVIRYTIPRKRTLQIGASLLWL